MRDVSRVNLDITQSRNYYFNCRRRNHNNQTIEIAKTRYPLISKSPLQIILVKVIYMKISVLGAGTVGKSWTALFLAHGYEVAVYDPSVDFESDLLCFTFNRK